MVTITFELCEAIRKAGFKGETIAPLIGLTGATFSHRKRGKSPWGLDECYGILDILEIPREDITKYFICRLKTKGISRANAGENDSQKFENLANKVNSFIKTLKLKSTNISKLLSLIDDQIKLARKDAYNEGFYEGLEFAKHNPKWKR